MSSQYGLSIGSDVYTFNYNMNAINLKELQQAYVDTYVQFIESQQKRTMYNWIKSDSTKDVNVFNSV